MGTNTTIDDDVNAIKKLGEEFFAGVNTGDLDRRMSTMDADAIIMPPNRPCIVGREDIRRLCKSYSAAYEEKCSLVYDEVETAGNWGFARATVTGIRISKSGGEVEQISLQNLWILKRQVDGKWKFWRIMFNSTLAL